MENPEQFEQVESSLPQPSPKRKYLLIGIIAALVVLVGGGVLGLQYIREKNEFRDPHEAEFLLTQQQEQKSARATEQIDTSDWQTYRNDEYGYEVRYPTDWEITSPFIEKTPEAVRIAKLIEKEGDAAFDIIVEANPFRRPATKEWYLDWVTKIPAGIDTSKYIFETMDFLGYQAVKVNNDELLFAKDLYMFRIRFAVSIYDPDRGFTDFAKPIFNQILSTFRFIE